MYQSCLIFENLHAFFTEKRRWARNWAIPFQGDCVEFEVGKQFPNTFVFGLNGLFWRYFAIKTRYTVITMAKISTG
jgi:hypothetical protein